MPRKTVTRQSSKPWRIYRGNRRWIRAARNWTIATGKRYSAIGLSASFVIRNRDMKPLVKNGGKP